MESQNAPSADAHSRACRRGYDVSGVFGRRVGEALIEDTKIDVLAHGRRQAGHEPLTLRLRGKSTTSPVAARCSFTPNCVPHGFLRLLTPALA
jgi:hypothetical protein